MGRKSMLNIDAEKEREIKNSRVKISNMVRRKKEIKKVCCICGNKKEKEVTILHNAQDPYLISFICKKCRINPENIKIAETRRFDLRDMLDRRTKSKGSYSNRDIKILINSYLTEAVSIKEYCKNQNISRYEFNRLIEQYAEIYNDKMIRDRIKAHANKANGKALQIIKTRNRKLKEMKKKGNNNDKK